MRPTDWSVRLVEWAEHRLGQPFAWGQVDCVMLALEAYDLLAAADPGVAEAWRGRYDSELSGAQLARDENTDLRGLLAGLGCVPVARGFQQRGDLILAWNGLYWCAHVCFGVQSLSARPESAVAWFDTAAVLAADEHGEPVILRAP